MLQPSRVGAVGLLTLYFVSGVAGAEEPQASASAAVSSSEVEKVASPPPRRDPKGIKGISPFAEALKHGDAAYLARDFAKAEAEYKLAVEAAPHEARGHLRLAAVAVQLGHADESLRFAEAAARFAGPDARLRADAFRLSALVLEASGSLDRAIVAWNAFATEDAKVPRKTPSEEVAAGHVARIEARQKALLQGAAVRERIQKELANTPGAVPAAAAPVPAA